MTKPQIVYHWDDDALVVSLHLAEPTALVSRAGLHELKYLRNEREALYFLDENNTNSIAKRFAAESISWQRVYDRIRLEFHKRFGGRFSAEEKKQKKQEKSERIQNKSQILNDLKEKIAEAKQKKDAQEAKESRESKEKADQNAADFETASFFKPKRESNKPNSTSKRVSGLNENQEAIESFSRAKRLSRLLEKGSLPWACAILNVTVHTPLESAKKQFRLYAKLWHPDAGAPIEVDAMVHLNQAWDIFKRYKEKP